MNEIQSMITAFFAHLRNENNLSEGTLESYLRDLSVFCDNLSEKGITCVEDVSHFDLIRYFSDMELEGKSPATVARATTSIRNFFAYLFELRKIDKNPAKSIKAPKVAKQSPASLSTYEIDQLMSLPDAQTGIGRRDRAILELLYGTGVRVSELTAIRREDLNFNLSFLKVTFGESARIIPLSDWLLKTLEAYLEDRQISNPSEWLFLNYKGEPLTRQGLWKIIKKYADMMQIEKEITPHTLRHTFMMHLIERGISPQTLGEVLGNHEQNGINIHYKAQADRLKAILEKDGHK